MSRLLAKSIGMESGGGCLDGEQLKFTMLQKILKFGIVGIIGAFCDYGSRSLLLLIGINPTVSRASSYIVGSAVAYTINSYYTFDGERSHAEKIRAATSYIVCFACAVIVDHYVRLEAPNHEHVLILSWVLSQGVATLLNFLLQNFWVFKASSPEKLD